MFWLFSGNGEGDDRIFSLLSDFRGHHSFDECMRRLRKGLFSGSRESVVPNTMLTEKNW